MCFDKLPVPDLKDDGMIRATIAVDNMCPLLASYNVTST